MSTTRSMLYRKGDDLLCRFVGTTIRGYQRLISPMLGNHCRFTPTCSSYALEAFKTKSFFRAFYLTLRRLSKCHPFHEGGYDPVV